MKRKLPTLCLILALGGLVRAQDSKSDPTGTWKQINPPSQTRETTFAFKLQGHTLTGTMLKSYGPIAITNGVVKGDDVSFQTLHEASYPKGKTVTETYTGKCSGDTISGNLAIEVDGTKFGTHAWEIKRETAESKDGASK